MQWILNGDIGGAYTMVVAYARYKNIMTMVTKKMEMEMVAQCSENDNSCGMDIMLTSLVYSKLGDNDGIYATIDIELVL